MSKLIAAINMTVDGFCDHTAVIADEEIHQHYSDLLSNAGIILYGRITYQLMEYWQPFLQNPTGVKSMDDFAIAIDKIQKIVFSHSLKHVDWATAKLAERGIEEEATALRQQPGKDILVGSPSLIVTLSNLHLIDEYQLCIHPVIGGKGLPLFKNIQETIPLKHLHTKTFGCGAVIHYYEPAKKG